jgi:mRNA interferase MazF
MKEGDVVLVSLIQSDGKSKVRPALILKKMPPFNDLLVCGISSQLSQRVLNFDEIINLNDRDFRQSGLVQPSLIRLGFLTVLSTKTLMGSIGSILPVRLERLQKTLSGYLIRRD